jgi:hypothetical protein
MNGSVAVAKKNDSPAGRCPRTQSEGIPEGIRNPPFAPERPDRPGGTIALSSAKPAKPPATLGTAENEIGITIPVWAGTVEAAWSRLDLNRILSSTKRTGRRMVVPAVHRFVLRSIPVAASLYA